MQKDVQSGVQEEKLCHVVVLYTLCNIRGKEDVTISFEKSL